MSDKLVSIKKICLSLNTLTFASTQILLFTLFPLLAEKLSLSLSTIVASFSLGTFLFLWGSPYWSSKSDKIGRDQVMSYGLAGLGISFAIIVALIHSQAYLTSSIAVTFLILSRLIYGLFASAIVPVAQLTRSELSSHDEQTKAMFTHSLTLSMGRTLGPLLLLLSVGHIQTLLLVISVWSFLLLGLNIILKNKELPQVKAQASDLKWREVGGQILWPLLITILFTTYTGVLHSSLGGTLQDIFLLNSTEASTLMAKVLMLGSIVMALTQILGKIFVKNHLRSTLCLGLAALSAGVVVLGNMDQTMALWISIALISLGIALIHPSNLALVHLSSDKLSLGKKVGLLSSGNTIGYAIGGTLASLFLGVGINTLSYIIVFALIFVGLISLKKAQA